jgi:hypothetical protein
MFFKRSGWILHRHFPTAAQKGTIRPDWLTCQSNNAGSFQFLTIFFSLIFIKFHFFASLAATSLPYLKTYSFFNLTN